MAHEFDNLSPRKQYGSHRRADLLSKLLKEGKDPRWIYGYEVELEKLIKRKLGFKEWDDGFDAGLFLDKKQDTVYVMLSKKNSLGSFECLEKVKYSEDLEAGTWLLDCLMMHKAHLDR